jgi:hypothetical protein
MAEEFKEIDDPVGWDRILEAFDFVPPGQAASWSACRHMRRQEILRFTTAKPGVVAVQGALKRTLGILRYLVDDGPLIGNACDEQAFVSSIRALRERLGKGSVLSFSSIQGYQPEHEIWLRKAGFQRPWSAVLSPLTLYVDCSDSARLEQGFSSDWRRNIRRADKKHLAFQVIPLSDKRAREDFLAIYSETFQIKGAAELIDAPMLEGFGRDPKWCLFFAAHDGERVSARLVFVHRATAFDFAAGTNAEGRRLSASHFLLASVLKRLGESGVRSFDCGRIGPGRYDSVDDFKRGSGGHPAAYLGEWSWSSRPWLELALGAARLLRRYDRW